MNVFITGASTGIGAALARCYARQGATLGLFARRGDALASLAAALAPATCASYAGDVRDADALRNAGADFMRRFGTPDIVIANSGISVGTSTQHIEDAAVFRAVLDTNVLGIVHAFQPFLGAMLESHRGKLVGIASVAGFRGFPGAGAYSASKAAAIAYLESLRVETLGTGVAVITICPGYIATEMVKAVPKDILEKSILSQIPVRRLGEPEEVARCVVFLVAEEAGFITGSTLTVNGGQYMI